MTTATGIRTLPRPAAAGTASDVVHDATWDGTDPVELGPGLLEYRCVDGSTFVTDDRSGMTLAQAQNQHTLAALGAHGLLTAFDSPGTPPF